MLPASKNTMIEKLIHTDSIAKTIFSYSNEGLFIAGGDGSIRYVNPKGLEMFGYAYEELINQKVEVLVPHSLKAKHVANRREFSKNPSNRSMGMGRHLLGLHKDGNTFPIEVSLSPFTYEGHDYVLAFISNITKRKEQEDQLNEMVSALDKSSKDLQQLNRNLEEKVNERTLELAETIRKLKDSQEATEKALLPEMEVTSMKSKFISTASHEFRTPLSTILSSATLIERYQGVEQQAQRKRHVNKIKNNVLNLNMILNGFLSLEKMEEGVIKNKPSKTNVTEFINEISEETESLKQSNQDLKVILNHQMDTVNVDPFLMKNIIINLNCTNNDYDYS